MSPLPLRPTLAALALATALAAPLPGPLWSFLVHLWSGAPPSPDAGCHLDPDGRCLPGGSALQPVVTPDNGCHADPSGLWLSNG